MSLFGPTGLVLPSKKVITTHSIESLGILFANLQTAFSASGVSTAWTANEAIFVPFVMTAPGVAKEMFVYNSGTVNGVTYIGLYTEDGYRICMKQANMTGSSQIQTYDIPDVLLMPGVYYMAYSSTGTGTYVGAVLGAAAQPTSGMTGVAKMATAAPLPAVATFASWTSVKVPLIGIAFTATY
jgi:hypothetical protein